MAKKLTDKRYMQRLQTLIAAMEFARKGEQPVYDLGPGERPQRAIQEFTAVARQEKITLVFAQRSKSLVLLFPEVEESKKVPFRVKRDGDTLSEGKR